jgi:hypothetical protein
MSFLTPRQEEVVEAARAHNLGAIHHPENHIFMHVAEVIKDRLAVVDHGGRSNTTEDYLTQLKVFMSQLEKVRNSNESACRQRSPTSGPNSRCRYAFQLGQVQ